jgi:hypothetical protein
VAKSVGIGLGGGQQQGFAAQPALTAFGQKPSLGQGQSGFGGTSSAFGTSRMRIIELKQRNGNIVDACLLLQVLEPWELVRLEHLATALESPSELNPEDLEVDKQRSVRVHSDRKVAALAQRNQRL